MPDVRCIECSKWSPQRCSEGMAKQGYGACEFHEPFICYAGIKDRDCDKWKAAPADVVEKRKRYLERAKVNG